MPLFIIFYCDIGFFVYVFLVVSALYFVLCVCMLVLSIGSVCSYVCMLYACVYVCTLGNTAAGLSFCVTLSFNKIGNK